MSRCSDVAASPRGLECQGQVRSCRIVIVCVRFLTPADLGRALSHSDHALAGGARSRPNESRLSCGALKKDSFPGAMVLCVRLTDCAYAAAPDGAARLWQSLPTDALLFARALDRAFDDITAGVARLDRAGHVVALEMERFTRGDRLSRSHDALERPGLRD